MSTSAKALIEPLERRCLLSAAAAIDGVGFLGDSYSDEYQFYPPTRASAMNWVAFASLLLARLRRVRRNPSPRKCVVVISVALARAALARAARRWRIRLVPCPSRIDSPISDELDWRRTENGHERRTITVGKFGAGAVFLALLIIVPRAAHAASAGFRGLGDLPGDLFESAAYGVSADGSAVAGYSRSASGDEAFRWTSGGGIQGLGTLSGHFASRAINVSGDGTTLVGFSKSAFEEKPFRWSTGGEGMLDLGQLSPPSPATPARSAPTDPL